MGAALRRPRKALLVALAGALVVALLLAARITVRGVMAARTPAESFVSSRPRAPGAPLPVLFRAPSFDLPESRGGRARSESLRGKVWIANFIFTQCTSVCPTMTARFTRLQRRLRGAGLRFVSFSVDPAHDRAETLREYATHWPLDTRWLLLETTPTALEEISRAMRVAVVPSADPRNPIVHSRLITLVDARGDVRAIYDSDDEQAWGRLADDANELLDADPAGVSEVAGSSAPLARFGCNGCHDRPDVAPRLAGGPGRTVRLATGETVTADADYLRESIVDPARRLTAGYAPVMPRYRDLSRADLDALVATIQALPPSASPDNAEGGPAEDPICHMQVSTVNPALSVRDGARVVHFCSRGCLHAYVAQHPGAR